MVGDLESLDSSFKGENSATDQRQFRCQPRLLDGAAHAQCARVHLSLTSFKPMSKCQNIQLVHKIRRRRS